MKTLCKIFSQFVLEINFICLFPTFKNAWVDILEDTNHVFQKEYGKKTSKNKFAHTNYFSLSVPPFTCPFIIYLLSSFLTHTRSRYNLSFCSVTQALKEYGGSLKG